MIAIVAVDENWGIGKDGKLLLHIPEDLRDNFKVKTLGHTVVYGRKTLTSFPKEKLLPKRENVILSRNPSFEKDGALILHAKEELLSYLSENPEKKIFLCGGAEIYRHFLSYCEEAYVTKIQRAFSADAFFPNLDTKKNWELVEESEVTHSVSGVDFTICHYKKIAD